MGYGDKLMAIGDAWKLHQEDPVRRRVAIGDGISLDTSDADLTWGLDHFLVSGADLEAGEDVTWVRSYPGQRPYIDYAAIRAQLEQQGLVIHKQRKLVARLGRYIWKHDYRPTPAPIALRPEEEAIVQEWRAKGPFIILEPFTKPQAPPSKQWPVSRFITVGTKLQRDIPVYQLSAPGRPNVGHFPQIRADSYRQTMAYLKAASLYIGPEGGLHHAAAAMGTRGVVLFGGFISPATTGYPELHVNLTGGVKEACGTRYQLCPHCQDALNSIRPDEVIAHARRQLELAHVH